AWLTLGLRAKHLMPVIDELLDLLGVLLVLHVLLDLVCHELSPGTAACQSHSVTAPGPQDISAQGLSAGEASSACSTTGPVASARPTGGSGRCPGARPAGT